MERPAFRRIMVPVDGSPCSEAAVAVALHLAAGGGALVFAHAINRPAIIAECATPYGGDPTAALDALEHDEAELLTREVARATKEHIAATTVALDGISYEEIARAAHEQQADAIVIGTRGLGGLARIFAGSTAEGVLRRSAVPTIVVRDGTQPIAGPFRCILVAIDESASAGEAAKVAVDLAARDGASVVFVHVVQSPDDGAAQIAITSAQEYADKSGVPCEIAILHGDAAAAAIRVSAEVCHADAIALGTHGRRGLERLILGSVAEAVIRQSTVPVIVVPSAAAGSHEANSAQPAASAQGL